MKSIKFLQTHIDYSLDTIEMNHPKPIITIFGTLENGEPIQVMVNDFFPYCYIQPIGNHSIVTKDLSDALERLSLKGKLISVESVTRRSLYGFSEEESEFFKCKFTNPHVLYGLKSILDEGINVGRKRVRFAIFESNLSFILRFMIDMNIVGMSYCKVNQYNLLDTNPLIISTSCDNIESLPLTGKNVILPRFKICSIDIECISLDCKSFPSASKDPIIQIGNTIAYTDSPEPISQDIFCLKETANIPGANVFSFEKESDLLLSWREYFMSHDPDIVIGFNIKGFDFPYILQRGEYFSLEGFNILGRTNKPSKPRDTNLSTRQFGTIAGFEIAFEGRMIFDLMQIIRRDFKLRSYSLNSVSLHFLQEQKEDVPHTSMNELHATNKDTRKRIASYCLKDTLLPLKLFFKLNVLINQTELSRVTGVPIEYFSTKGTSIKVLNLIYKAAAKNGYLIPVLNPLQNDASFEGGFVMEPEKGFYSQPIAVLDFSSLYPSIMISKNLCYSTLLTKEQYEKYGGIKTPTNNYFALPEVRKGILPMVLKDLLSSRSSTKIEMKEETDPNMKSCLNARQMAFKVCANSIYGFTGATVGKLPCLEISQSVTSFGREMIAFTKKCIEENFNTSKGCSHDAKVIYGDTDSVMINFKESNMHKVFQMAKEISGFVSRKFIKPVSLEFEKVYSPYLLINKKRYAGLIYTDPDKASKIDTKGIETVRRDNCELVKQVIETCLHKILIEKDLNGAVKYVKDVVRDLYLGKIDLSLLVISKSLTKTGDKYASKQAHVELAERMKKRGDEVSLSVGSRIAYIIIKKGKNIAAYEKAEDPVYVLEKNLPIDTEYYIEQQLANPLHRIFEPIIDNVSELLKGEHTRTITRNVTLTGPMNAFLKPTTSCIGCKSVGKILCTSCRPDLHKHLLKLQTEVELKERQFHSCWTECQRCQGSLFDEILCANRDCPIFYMRTRVKKELLPLSEKLKLVKELDW